MYPDHQQQPSRSTEPQTTKEPRDSPWSNLRLSVPNTRSGESIVAFVECVLVELTHEDVGAEYITSNVAGVKRTQFIAVDDIGETFHKRYYNERLGWHETTVSREAVRDELINRLTRSSSLATDGSHDVIVDSPDRFPVKPARELRVQERGN